MLIRKLIQDYFNCPPSMTEGLCQTISSGKIKAEYRLILSWVSQSQGPIGIHLPFGRHYFQTLLACMEVGKVFIPLRESWPKAHLSQVCDQLSIETVIEKDSLVSILNQKSNQRKAITLPPLSSNQSIYQICTSGTSGTPKVVDISRNAYSNFIQWMKNYFNELRNETLLCTTHYTFDVSYAEIGFSLLYRGPMHFSTFTANADVFSLANEIESKKVSLLFTVPNNINLLLSELVYKRTDLSHLKNLVLAGQRFSKNTYDLIFQKLPHSKSIYNAYGPTEGTIYTHVHKMSRNDSDFNGENVSIGTPVDNMTCSIVQSENEKKGERQTPNKQGELWVAGPQIMKGYINNLSETKKVLVKMDGKVHYRTGDLCFQNDRGNHFVVGRMDDTIKRRGFRINLSDIDAYIQKIAGIGEAATVAELQKGFEYKLIAFVKLTEKINFQEIKKRMAKMMVSYQIPDVIKIIDQFPTNNSGKICKRTLLDHYCSLRKSSEKH